MEINQLKELLDRETARINTPEFIVNDPVQFPRRFSALPDIEIAALLSATIAWGNRKMICNNCQKMLDLMYLLRGLRRIYKSHGSLNEFATANHVGDSEEPAWRLVELMQQELAAANGDTYDSRCLPTNLKNTALKRINMALRWFVRDDGIVDMGVWTAIKPSQLFIPLDVHVGDTARQLGMTTRHANDKKTVLEITNLLRQLRPNDPIIYDFALFGYSMNN